MEEYILEAIQADPFLKLQHELKAFGLALEHYHDWLGEKATHKYIVLRGTAHVAYANTLAGVRKALAREKRAVKAEHPTQIAALSQLALFD